MDANARFLSAYARSLQADGLSAHRVEAALLEAAEALELPARVAVAPTMILLSLGDEESAHTVMLPVSTGWLDVARFIRNASIADAVTSGRMTCEEGITALQRPTRPLYGGVADALAGVVVAGAAAPLFGGGMVAVVGAAAGAAGVSVVKWITERIGMHDLQLPLASGVGGGLAMLVTGAWGGNPTAAMLGALILLMPGFSATLATTELATGNSMAGVGRAAGVVSTLVQLGLGLAVATHLVGATHPVVERAVPLFPAILATGAAFTVVLGAPVRLLPWLTASVALAWGSLWVGAAHLGPLAGAAFAAWALATGARLVAPRLGLPPSILIVPGLLMLVPGATGFRAVVEALSGDVVVGADLLVEMLLTLAALAMGLLAGAAVRRAPREVVARARELRQGSGVSAGASAAL